MSAPRGVVRSMPRHNWLGEVAANVSNRVGKWEDWEKSPALKSSEERLRNYKPEESVSSSGPAQPEKKTGQDHQARQDRDCQN